MSPCWIWGGRKPMGREAPSWHHIQQAWVKYLFFLFKAPKESHYLSFSAVLAETYTYHIRGPWYMSTLWSIIAWPVNQSRLSNRNMPWVVFNNFLFSSEMWSKVPVYWIYHKIIFQTWNHVTMKVKLQKVSCIRGKTNTSHAVTRTCSFPLHRYMNSQSTIQSYRVDL